MILSILYNYISHLILTAGGLTVLVSLFLTMIPIIKTYKVPLNVAGILLIGVGCYMEGSSSYKEKIDLKVSSLQVQLADARIAASQKNVEIVTEILTDTRIIKEKGENIIKYVDREIVKYNDQCKIPDDVVNVINDAVMIGN